MTTECQELDVGNVQIETNVDNVKNERLELDVVQLSSDSELRIPIHNYDVNVQLLILRSMYSTVLKMM